ncbi:MAG: Acetyltransferase YpeA [bacterium]|nr:Acetyltransferase YpeA [bacterium]
MPALTIRPYQDPEEASVVALWGELLDDGSPHNDPLTSLRRKLALSRELLFVALLDDLVVGTAMGRYDGRRGWIHSVAVKPEFQRHGIGTALIRRVEEDLKSLGCPKVNLQIRASNSGVAGFYQRLGYTVEERISMGKRLHDRAVPPPSTP